MIVAVPGFPQQATALIGGGTVKNNGSVTVYYRDEPGVTQSVNDGSITAGSSVTLDGAQWFACAAGSSSQLTVLPAPVSNPLASMPILTAWDPGANQQTCTFSANNLKFVFVVVPVSGVISDFSVIVTTSSGNLIPTIYDCGVRQLGSYSPLWSPASLACPAAVSAGASTTPWQSLGNPALSVTAGQRLMLGVLVDNATVVLGGRQTAPGSVVNIGLLPATYLPHSGGTVFRQTMNYGAASFVLPAAFTDADSHLFNVSAAGSPGIVCSIT